MADSLLSLDNEVFKRYMFYAGVVLTKTIGMSLWIAARYRIPRKVFSSPEDYTGQKNVTLTTDPDIERVRRCHLNDLENVLPFVLIGLLFVMTSPSLTSATAHFGLFTAFRLLHTVSYLWAIPQPARFLCWLGGFCVNASMAAMVIMTGSSGF